MGLEGLNGLIAIATLVSAGAQIAGGVAGRGAARIEARAQEEEGALLLLEANEEADRVNTANIKFRKKQKLAFLKRGVVLAGSPLLILEETRREGTEEVESIRRRGQAQFRLSQQRADIFRASGRASLISGIGGAFSTVSTAGLFNTTPAPAVPSSGGGGGGGSGGGGFARFTP